MKFLVSHVSQDQIDDCGDEGLFAGIDGELYNFCIDHTEGQDVVITDNIGRVMPIDISDVGTIAATLARISKFEKAQIDSTKANLAELIGDASF